MERCPNIIAPPSPLAITSRYAVARTIQSGNWQPLFISEQPHRHREHPNENVIMDGTTAFMAPADFRRRRWKCTSGTCSTSSAGHWACRVASVGAHQKNT